MKKGQSKASSIELKFKYTKRGQDSTNKEDQKVHVMGTRIPMLAEVTVTQENC